MSADTDAGFAEKDGVLCADGVPLPAIAQKCGTPSYVYSAGRMATNAQALEDAFRAALPPRSQPLIAYACKANGNTAVLKLFSKRGFGADVVSGGELMRALRGGMTPEKIVFSGVGKTDEEIAFALETKVRQINVESGPELRRISALARRAGVRAPVALRFNPDVDAGTHAKITTGKSENKFGLAEEDVRSLYAVAAKDDALTLRGLSIHIGSQLTSVEPFAQAFGKLARLAADLKAQGLKLDTLDLGGGLGIAYRDERGPCLKDYAAAVRDIIHPLGADIIVEPGRFLTGDAGLLLARILYIKESRGRKYMILDAGMNDLIRPSLYDAWHPIRPVAGKGGGAATEHYDVVGPVCETGDTFAKNRALPADAQPGDLVAVMAAGAYGFSMSSRYNSRPHPPEILVRKGRFDVIRQREDIRDIINEDLVPAWLDT